MGRAGLIAFVCLMGITAGLASSASADIMTATYDPSLGTLPTEQGWNLNDTQNSPAVVEQGILHQGPTSGYQSWWNDQIPLDFDEGVTVEATVKTISSPYSTVDGGRTGWSIYVADQVGRLFIVGLADSSPGGIFIKHTGSPATGTALKEFDPSDDFHTYRLAVDSDGASLYIDDDPAAFLTLELGPTGEYSENWVTFGDGTGWLDTEVLIESFSYTNVPEPATLSLLALGGLALLRRRR